MNTSCFVWLGVKLQERPLKIWTYYKAYYEEQDVVDLQQ